MPPISAAKKVDPLAGFDGDANIYQDENGVVWNVMLNYTNITYGTYGNANGIEVVAADINNKYYMVQLIQQGKNYVVFRKWGRVGAKKPQRTLEQYQTSLDKAKESFQKRFFDKTGNEWPLQGPFEKVEGKYVFVELDGVEPEDDDADSDANDIEENTTPSTLHERVQDAIKLICDANLIAQEVTAMNVDLKRMPLGRLSKAQISRGYALLQTLSNTLQIIDELKKTDNVAVSTAEVVTEESSATSTRRRSTRLKRTTSTNSLKIRKLKNELKSLSSEFYTLIPHDFGHTLPPSIDTIEEVKLKIDLLQVLSDIEISQKLQKEKKKSRQADEKRIHLLDAQYQLLNISMEPVLETEDEYGVIERYVATTHAPTHINYKLKVNSIFKISRPDEDSFQEVFNSIGNHKLLWHGSRLSNVVGILSKGLRIAPPEAPSNGYMFGKGLYFADSVSKSANYCWTSSEQPRGVLILAEVALGTLYHAFAAEALDYQSLKTGKGCDSTLGVGRMAASEESHEIMKDGVVVPIGEFEPTDANGELLYNEFIVYRTEQVKLRYLVILDFLYEM